MSATVKPCYRENLEKLNAPRTKLPKDGKTWLGFLFWNLINKLIIAFHFRGKISVDGAGNIPSHGPFILIANHSSRWDGPLVQHILDRRANYMVAPKEMEGLQGAAVMSVGAFPAHPRLNPVGYAIQQLHAQEPVVVFPEGNVFYDGSIHPFKTGVAKIALDCRKNGFDVQIVPMFIEYTEKNNNYSAKVVVGKPLGKKELTVSESSSKDAQRALSDKLYEQVVALRDGFQVSLQESKSEEFVELRCSA